MTDLLIYAAAGFMVWMCLDCIQRREHFIWIIIMIILFPVGAVAYFFVVKNRAAGGSKTPQGFSSPTPIRKEVETEETLQLKELIGKFNKAFHYEKLGQVYLEQKKYEMAIPQFEEAIQRDSEMLEARYGLAKCYHGLGDFEEGAKALEKLTEAAGDDETMSQTLAMLKELNSQGAFDEVSFDNIWNIIQAVAKTAD